MLVQRFILARLRNRQLYSLAEFNDAVGEELEALNGLPMKDCGGQTRKQRFEELDKPYAQALPAHRFTMSRIKTDVRVGPNYQVRFKDHFHSVPHHPVGQHVEVHVSGCVLAIYRDGVHLCRPAKGPRDFAYTTTATHPTTPIPRTPRK